VEGPLSPDDGGARAPRYRLRPSVELYPDATGDVYLLRPGHPHVVVRGPSAPDRQLLEELANGAVTASPGDGVAERLAPLLGADLVVADREQQRLPDTWTERFARQLPYFAETADAGVVQRRLRSAHVAVLGCGGLGTWALGAIACLGVGRFTLVDDDRVDLSNLNRQILYGVRDVGRFKASCAARWLRSFDPEVRVDTLEQRLRSEDDVARATAGADLVVMTADWPPYEIGRWVNAACVATEIPFILAGQQPPILKVGPTYVPGCGPCFACHETQIAAAFPAYRALAKHRRDRPAPAATLGPASAAVGSLLALDALALLRGDHRPATFGRALLFDMETFAQRWETVERDPRCPACAPLHAR
jgi:bacteriocin biosynthesis cyclodehydratase domain-containing protein